MSRTSPPRTIGRSAPPSAPRPRVASAPLVFLLNGPNLNRLGDRDPALYGHTTLAQAEAQAQALATSLGLVLECRQSNHEGVLIDWIQEARAVGASALIINPGALGHTSLALADSLRDAGLFVVEVHISNTQKREAYRNHTHLSAVADGIVMGLGTEGYLLGVRAVASRFAKPQTKPKPKAKPASKPKPKTQARTR